MAAVDERTFAVQAWSLQEITAALTIAENTQRAALADWETFVDWWAAGAAAKQSQQTVELLQAARDAAAHIGTAYMNEVLSVLGVGQVSDTRLDLPPARLGADLTKVYMRPAAEYRRAFALTGSEEEAKAAASERLSVMVADDLLVARRDGEQEILRRSADVKGWRRILHPELARDGSCGLCIAASHQKYRTSQLRAIHGRCNCSVAPVVGDFDPRVVNDADLAEAYAAAGSNKAADLKRARFKINEHGELGPVLTDPEHKFQGPGDPDNVDPVARAKRRLTAAEKVLTELEGTDDNPAALHYQRKFVTHLRSVADQAA